MPDEKAAPLACSTLSVPAVLLSCTRPLPEANVFAFASRQRVAPASVVSTRISATTDDVFVSTLLFVTVASSEVELGVRRKMPGPLSALAAPPLPLRIVLPEMSTLALGAPFVRRSTRMPERAAVPKPTGSAAVPRTLLIILALTALLPAPALLMSRKTPPCCTSVTLLPSTTIVLGTFDAPATLIRIAVMEPRQGVAPPPQVEVLLPTPVMVLPEMVAPKVLPAVLPPPVKLMRPSPVEAVLITFVNVLLRTLKVPFEACAVPPVMFTLPLTGALWKVECCTVEVIVAVSAAFVMTAEPEMLVKVLFVVTSSIAPPVVSVMFDVPAAMPRMPALPVAFWNVEPVTDIVAEPVVLVMSRPSRFATLKPETVLPATALLPERFRAKMPWPPKPCPVAPVTFCPGLVMVTPLMVTFEEVRASTQSLPQFESVPPLTAKLPVLFERKMASPSPSVSGMPSAFESACATSTFELLMVALANETAAGELRTRMPYPPALLGFGMVVALKETLPSTASRSMPVVARLKTPVASKLTTEPMPTLLSRMPIPTAPVTVVVPAEKLELAATFVRLTPFVALLVEETLWKAACNCPLSRTSAGPVELTAVSATVSVP